MTTLGGEVLGGRFELRSELGRGAFGTVFRAYDRTRGHDVALKRLDRLEPAALLHFQREFRGLADLVHPSLVPFHDLHEHDGSWFASMELIEGARTFDRIPLADFRDAFERLVLGVLALHASDRLHRDLKPSNVLLSADGRLAILDFGLTAKLASSDLGAFGSADYASPEQLLGEALDERSDGYSLGVMLYERVFGRRPFEGPGAEVMARKIRQDPPEHPLAVPEFADLVGLARALVKRDPASRPSSAEIVKALGIPLPTRHVTSEQVLEGRERELSVLRQMLDAVRSDARPRLVLLEGPSGIGKSTLASTFDPVKAQVLRGRCYRGAAVPYNGLDELVERLASQKPQRDAACLLFPTLGTPPEIDATEPALLKLQALDALATRMRQHANGLPMVWVLDDVQWCGADTVGAIQRMLRSGALPPVLLVATSRSKAFGAAMSSSFFESKTLALSPLDAPSIARIARAQLALTSAEASVQRVVQLSAGDPYLAHQLCRALRAGEQEPKDITELADARLSSLAPRERDLVRTLSVAAQPLTRAQLCDALERPLEGGEVERLVRGRLVTAQPGEAAFEVYHARIGEAVAASLDAITRNETHAALARALSPSAEPSRIAYHYAESGQTQAAYDAYLRGARTAADQFAFERAIEWVDAASALDSSEDSGRLELTRLRADLLAKAGRGLDAANAYETAASLCQDVGERAELRRLQAEQLLHGGHLEAGLRETQRALRAAGSSLPPTRAHALARALYHTARFRLRRLEVDLDHPSADAALGFRIDALWAAGVGLSTIDSLKGIALLTESTVLALDTKDPYRSVRSLLMQACFVAARGPRGLPLAREILALCAPLAEELDDAYLRAMVAGTAGVIALHAGQFSAVPYYARIARKRFLSQDRSASRELATTDSYALMALSVSGRFAQMRDDVIPQLAAAEATGNRFTQANLQSGLIALGWIAADQVEHAKNGLAQAEGLWPRSGMHVQHFFNIHGHVAVALYEGQPETAAQRVEDSWSEVRLSAVWRLPIVSALALEMRGRAALARGDYRTAERCLLSLKSRPSPYARGFGATLEAILRIHRKGLESAQPTIRRAAAIAAASGLRGHRAFLERMMGTPIPPALGIARAERLATIFLPGCKLPSKWPAIG